MKSDQVDAMVKGNDICVAIVAAYRFTGIFLGSLRMQSSHVGKIILNNDQLIHLGVSLTNSQQPFHLRIPDADYLAIPLDELQHLDFDFQPMPINMPLELAMSVSLELTLFKETKNALFHNIDICGLKWIRRCIESLGNRALLPQICTKSCRNPLVRA